VDNIQALRAALLWHGLPPASLAHLEICAGTSSSQRCVVAALIFIKGPGLLSHDATIRVSVRSDSLAERSEFELPVPVSKLSSDSHRVLDVEHSPEKCAKVPRARRSRERE
jgi:hypothetical protein